MQHTSMASLLLIFHIVCGFISLFCALSAMLATKGHPAHRKLGRVFFYGMTGVFITAIPLSLIKNNLFLFLIAFFSYYLAFSGWRYAKNKKGSPAAIDFIASWIMIFSAFSMIIAGIYLLNTGNFKAIVLLVFGIIGIIFSFTDLKDYRNNMVTGKKRIAKHLSAMLGATIATLTAFSVTNIHITPKIIVWLGPTVILTPVIIWWKYKITKDGINLYRTKSEDKV